MKQHSTTTLLIVVLGVFTVIAPCVVLAGRGNKNGRRKSADKDGTSSPTRDYVDPHKTWLSFVRNQQPKNTGSNAPRLKQRSRKMHIIEGPAGPPGATGPPGPPGALITEAAMMVQFRSLVRDTAARRSERFAGQSFGLLAAGVPDVLSGFHIEAKLRIDLPGRKKMELHELEAFKTGTFVRGHGVDLHRGRFTVPFTAVYQLHATIHVTRPTRDVITHRKDSIVAQVCINGDCRKNAGLTTIVGLSSNSKLFTISVQGILYLMANSYVSVFVENSSSSTIFVTEGSTFSGIMIGA